MTSLVKLSCLLTLLSTGSTKQFANDAPAPASNVQFQIPLADNTTATAVLLPITDEQSYLVYATSTGRIGLYLLTSTKLIPPIPPIPPPDPPYQVISIAIIENPSKTTIEQSNILADPTWRALARTQHNLIGIIPFDVIDFRTGKTPSFLSRFIDLTINEPLPYVVMLRSDNSIYWKGQLPSTVSELRKLIPKKRTKKNDHANHNSKRLDKTTNRSQQASRTSRPLHVPRMQKSQNPSHERRTHRTVAKGATTHTQVRVGRPNQRSSRNISSQQMGNETTSPRPGQHVQMLGARIDTCRRTFKALGKSKTVTPFSRLGSLSDRGNKRSRRLAGRCLQTACKRRCMSASSVARSGTKPGKCRQKLERPSVEPRPPTLALGVKLQRANDLRPSTNPSCDSSMVVGPSCLPDGPRIDRHKRIRHPIRQLLGLKLGRRWLGHFGRRIRHHRCGSLCSIK